MIRGNNINTMSDFNPPTPRGVGPFARALSRPLAKFQSTHPARGGTGWLCVPGSRLEYFNPPTPRGVGPSSIAFVKHV